MLRGRAVVLFFTVVLIVTGCKVPLYSSLGEQEVVDMMSLLLRSGIPCEKKQGEEQSFVLIVDKENFATAAEILQRSGFPKDDSESFETMYKKQGMISSPLEERVRYIYAMSGEIAKTISKIDGVLTARVHVVLPENDPMADSIAPSSASVFIKSHPLADLKTFIPQIKQLVINSVEGLSKDNVYVAIFPGSQVGLQKNVRFKKFLGLSVGNESFLPLIGLITSLFVTNLLLLGSAVYMMVFLKRNKFTFIDLIKYFSKQKEITH